MIEKFLKSKKIWIAIVILLVTVIWIAWGNTALELNAYTISSNKLPESFSGYRIAHVSDLHNAEFGENNALLLEMLKEAEPDMIAITGDLVDSYHTDIQVGIEFAQQAAQIAPTYYVTGNHEARISEYDELEKGLEAAGVVILKNESVELEKDGEYITLIGVNDPSFKTDYLFGDSISVMDANLEEISENAGEYTLLLSHRPELFKVYVANDMDLVLSGHAHGGQFRLPFLGGVIAPSQGFFPEYDAGLYVEDDTNMIVSRGLGNSLFPFRVNNRPEVILIELEKE